MDYFRLSGMTNYSFTARFASERAIARACFLFPLATFGPLEEPECSLPALCSRITRAIFAFAFGLLRIALAGIKSSLAIRNLISHLSRLSMAHPIRLA